MVAMRDRSSNLSGSPLPQGLVRGLALYSDPQDSIIWLIDLQRVNCFFQLNRRIGSTENRSRFTQQGLTSLDLAEDCD